MSEIDPLFGMHAQSLSVQRQRMEVLASNLANADTPNYQARDIDFAKVLAGTQETAANIVSLTGTDPNHAVGSSSSSTIPLSYRQALQPSVDGNTVDEQVEQSAYADAALHYQASLSFLSGQIKSLMTAITGQ